MLDSRKFMKNMQKYWEIIKNIRYHKEKYHIMTFIVALITALAALIANINFTPDFGMTIDPNHGEIQPGEEISTKISIESKNGYNNKVILTAIEKPSSITVNFYPQNKEPSYTSIAIIFASQDVPKDQYLITINGIGNDGKKQSVYYVLTVCSYHPVPVPRSTVPPRLSPSIKLGIYE